MTLCMRWACGLLILASGAIFEGCASVPEAPVTAQPGDPTPRLVKKAVQRGKTTPAELQQAFGAPTIIITDQQGREVWTYDFVHARPSVPEGSKAGDKTQAPFSLMVFFGPGQVVEEYRIQMLNETR